MDNEICPVCNRTIWRIARHRNSDGVITHFECHFDYERKLSAKHEGVDGETAETEAENLITLTTSTFPDRNIVQVMGLVRGSTVRSRNVGSDFGASLKSIVGGELKGVTRLLADAREQAMARMCREGLELGANAIVEVRFSTSQVWEGAAEVMAYGTAVLTEEPAAQQSQEND